MKNQGLFLLACFGFLTVNDVLAQAWTTLGGNYLRTDASTDGVVIGNIGSSPSPTVGLLVDGANLNTPTGEVFRTIGPSATATYWKLFRASDEMARLYVNSTGDGVFIRPMQTSGNVWVMNTDQDAFRIRHNASSTLNGWTLSRSGFASLGNGGNIGGSGNEKPWARLHLVHEGTGADNSMGWRPHMRNGVLGTGNNDLAYMGQMFDMTSSGTGSEQNNNSNVLIGWGSPSLTASTNSWDNCTFRFYTDPSDGNAGSASTVRGLEIMRMRPCRSASNTAIEGYVGLGDWAVGSDLPTERLDLLTGNVRVRSLPGTSPTADDKVVVVDANGVLHWRTAASLTAADCRWTMPTGGGAGTNHLSTAYGTGALDCPDAAEAVGIGVNLAGATPIAKVEIETSVYDTAVAIMASTTADRTTGLSVIASGASMVSKGINVAVYDVSDTAIGVQSRVNTSGDLTYGALLVAEGTGSQSVGVHGRAYDGADHCVGVEGHSYGAGSMLNAGVIGNAVSDGTALTYWGVYGTVTPPSTGDVMTMYGLYGSSIDDPDNFINSFGVYCEGRQGSTSDFMWEMPSDELLKENIEELDSALITLLQLQPKKYNYRVEEFPSLHLTSRLQYGLLANDVESVLPFMVSPASKPAMLDEDGNEVAAAVEYKTMRYGPLLMLLIAAVQEQNDTITALQQLVADTQTSADQVAAMQGQMQAMQQQLSQMQDQIAACCAGGMAPQGDGELRGNADDVMGDERALRIAPNPFTDRTTLYCNLERAGRMQLLANSADGRSLMVLSEGQREAGEFQHTWSTENLAPGVYYITLLLDGEPVVKRAVKVGR